MDKWKTSIEILGQTLAVWIALFGAVAIQIYYRRVGSFLKALVAIAVTVFLGVWLIDPLYETFFSERDPSTWKPVIALAIGAFGNEAARWILGMQAFDDMVEAIVKVIRAWRFPR